MVAGKQAFGQIIYIQFASGEQEEKPVSQRARHQAQHMGLGLTAEIEHKVVSLSMRRLSCMDYQNSLLS